MALVDPVPFRPFSKVLTVAANTEYPVTLTDSSGLPILCNYAQVTVLGGITNAGFVLVEPSGISRNVRIAPGNGAAGTLGTAATVMDPAELYLGGADYCSALTLSGSTGLGTVSAFVTYGVRVQPNPLGTLGREVGK
jgi:hypothetical protein